MPAIRQKETVDKSVKKSKLEEFKDQLQSLKKERDKYVNDYEKSLRGFEVEIDKTRTLLEELIDKKDKLEQQFFNKLKLKDQKIKSIREKIERERSITHA